MTVKDGRWEGPILDNHFHLDPAGRGVDAALDFKRAGGTHLVLVHKPDFESLPTTIEQISSSYDGTIKMAESVRKELDLDVRVVLGPHPAAWFHQTVSMGLEEANKLHLGAVELAIEHCEEGRASGIGEIGRPHWDVGDEAMARADEVLIDMLAM